MQLQKTTFLLLITTALLSSSTTGVQVEMALDENRISSSDEFAQLDSTKKNKGGKGGKEDKSDKEDEQEYVDLIEFGNTTEEINISSMTWSLYDTWNDDDVEKYSGGIIYLVLMYVDGSKCDKDDQCLHLEEGFQKMARDSISDSIL